MQLRLAFWVAWAGILIPLSVDHRLGLELGDYTVRGQYFGALLWIALELALAIRGRSLEVFRELWRRPENRFFAALAVPALAALFLVTPNPSRGVFFLLWSLGTLTVVPWLARRVGQRLGNWGRWSLYAYYALQSVIICLDAAICIPTQGEWSIGTVMVYRGLHAMSLCRPSAFYQEPGFFAASAALVALLAVHELKDAAGERKRALLKVFLGLLIVALVVCLSRLGWLVALLLIGFLIHNAWSKPKRAGPRRRASSPRAWKSWAVIGLAAAVALTLAVEFGPVVKAYLGNPVPSRDASILSRSNSIRDALRVFAESPLFGVGPGNSGPYLVENFHVSPNEVALMRRVPVALSLYPELLAEWGLLGFGLFFAGLWALARSLPRRLTVQLFLMLGVIYTSTQTLPRFDLWLIIGFLSAQSLPFSRAQR